LRDIVQAAIDGLLQGGIYSLLAAGLALIFGVMRIINFGQGGFFMLGMYATYVFWDSFGLDPFLAAIPVAVILFVLGSATSVGLINRLPRGNQDAQLLLTLGIAIVLESAVLMYFGAQPRAIRVSYSSEFLDMGDLLVPKARLYAALASVVVMLGLHLFLTGTWLGRALRATADDASAASAVGIPVKSVDAMAFGIGTGLAAVAGALLASFQGMSPAIGNTYIIIMFVAVALGGLGSIGGAIMGAIVIGLIQSFAILWLPRELEASVVFGVFLLVLLVRPHGLFGVRARV
jgi:branched-chain amino acid transport system permease protein